MVNKELEIEPQPDSALMKSDIGQSNILAEPQSGAYLKILEQLRQNEKISKDILKSLNFVRHYYLWQSVFNFLKLFIIIAVIVLGIVSWRSAINYVTSALSGGFPEQIQIQLTK